MRNVRIGNHQIGADSPPFIIAEMSGNHNQSLDRALALVEAAAAAGVHALKIQTYTAETMTLNLRKGEFMINDPKSLWHGNSLYELYEKAHTPWEWHKPIFERSRELGLLYFSTPFDATAVDFLETFDVPCYKIASFENSDLPLIKKVASTGKPIILSTGMATVAELDEAIRTARIAGCSDIILLKCTSTYPASPKDSNLMTLPHLRDLFACEVGVSDHTLGIGAAIAAVALGASVIEKHFTLRREEGGVDAAFSLEPQELAMLVTESESARQALGGIHYGSTQREQASMRYRRSLYIVQDMHAGDIVTPQNLRAIRPGLGLSPKYYDVLLGKRVKRDLKKGSPFQWDMIE